MKPSLIVHGGAWNIPDDLVEACRAGCERALEVGMALLARGADALVAVEEAICVLEDDPVFDAGRGAHLNRVGEIELDAIIMNGTTLDAGAVAAVTGVRNPIRLARRLLDTGPEMMVVGAGARRFADEQRMPICDPSELVVPRERAAWERWRDHPDAALSDFATPSTAGDTVGAVAIDARGHMAAGTSTGGTLCKRPGRVGDSPLIGCGCYADDEVGAASCTGLGEAVMRVVLAKTAVDRLRGGEAPDSVAGYATALLRRRGRGTGGLILLDRTGTAAVAHTTTRMAYAYVGADGAVVAGPSRMA